MTITSLQDLLDFITAEHGDELEEAEARDLLEFCNDANQVGADWAERHNMGEQLKGLSAVATYITANNPEDSGPALTLAAMMDGDKVGSAYYTFFYTLVGALVKAGYLDG